jgi:glycosyltransferase involved in cell wall biosynthesis
VNVAIAYDCLYPFTVGGAEKYYRGLAERLARRHRVSFLTREQWGGGVPPRIAPNVEVIPVCEPSDLYGENGRRRIEPTLAYGRGLFRHLVRHRRAYDVVHVASFPFFSVLAARAASTLGGSPYLVDWLEVWSRDGWQTYLGGRRAAVGLAIQQLCIRLSDPALVHSELHARRLEDAGCRRVRLLRGLYEGATARSRAVAPRPSLAVFAGRHIPEKGVAAIPAAIAIARREVPDLEATLFGDGPERSRVEREIARLGLQGVVRCEGFAPEAALHAALARAMCLVLPSSREGYGLVIVEAAAFGTPSIVLHAPESAATELIAPGENGVVIDSAEPAAIARALVDVSKRRSALVATTSAWFRANAARLSIEASVTTLEEIYREVARTGARSAGMESPGALVS